MSIISIPFIVSITVIEYLEFQSKAEAAEIVELISEAIFHGQTYENASDQIHRFFFSYQSTYNYMFSSNDSHLAKSRHLILEGAKQCTSYDRVIILAPGHLEPIAELSTLFKEVIIIGCNRPSFQQLIKKEKNIRMIQKDLSGGFLKKFAAVFDLAVEKRMHELVLINEVIDAYEDEIANPSPMLENLNKTADYVVSSSILSQLVVGDILKELHRKIYEKTHHNKILTQYQFFEKSAPIIQNRHISWLNRIVKPDGAVYISDSTYIKKNGKWVPLYGLKTTLPKICELFSVVMKEKWKWVLSFKNPDYGHPQKYYMSGMILKPSSSHDGQLIQPVKIHT